MKKYLFIVLLVGVGFGQIYYPDSTKIIYNEWCPSQYCSLMVMDINGQSLNSLPMDSLYDAFPSSSQALDVSPDGNKVVFSGDNGSDSNVFIVHHAFVCCVKCSGR